MLTVFPEGNDMFRVNNKNTNLLNMFKTYIKNTRITSLEFLMMLLLLTSNISQPGITCS